MNIYSFKEKLSKITPTNKNPIYNSHLYWSQKPYNITDLLISEFTEEGEYVFDPFMGSGVSLLEAVKLNRKGLGVEINELPIFIVKTLLTEFNNLNEIKSFLGKFEEYIQNLRSYYKTLDPNLDNWVEIKKVVFDRETPFSEPLIKNIYYSSKNSRKNIIKIPDLFDINQYFQTPNYNHIDTFIMHQNSRLGVQKNQDVSTLFTPRALKVIDDVLEYVKNLKNKKLKNIIKYILMSSLHLIKITDLKSNSQWPLWTPKINCVEKNAIDIIQRRIWMLFNAFKNIHEEFKQPIKEAKNFTDLSTSDYLIFNKPIQNINNSNLPDNSVDLVITDPPYLGQVLYSEYMQLYYPFFKFNFDLENEIVISNGSNRKKDETSYFDLLDLSFTNITKKLKKGKIMCLYFHDSNLNVWDKLIKITQKNGLHFIGQAHIHKKLTLKNILSPKKSLQGDSILFFINEKYKYKYNNKNETIQEIVENIVRHIIFEIEKKGPLTTTQLMDEGLMEYIIQNNWLPTLAVNYKNIIDVFEQYITWDASIGKWIGHNND